MGKYYYHVGFHFRYNIILIQVKLYKITHYILQPSQDGAERSSVFTM